MIPPTTSRSGIAEPAKRAAARLPPSPTSLSVAPARRIRSVFTCSSCSLVSRGYRCRQLINAGCLLPGYNPPTHSADRCHRERRPAANVPPAPVVGQLELPKSRGGNFKLTHHHAGHSESPRVIAKGRSSYPRNSMLLWNRGNRSLRYRNPQTGLVRP